MELKCINVLTKDLSLKYNFVPVKEDSKSITCYYNSDEDLHFLNIISEKEIFLIEKPEKEIIKARNTIYKKSFKDLINKETELLNKNKNSERNIVNLLNYIISYAVDINSSDIHIEGLNDIVIFRIRIDGVLNDLCRIDKYYHQNIISRIKVLSNLDYTVKNIPQDSRFTFNCEDRKIDIRVATIPTVNGEKIVLRLLDKNKIEYTKSGIGLYGANLNKINLLLKQPQGLILSVGPTGSGKSSTIYTLIQDIYTREKNIITIEDPVEYKIDGINQININENVGMNFEKGLEAILRLDPDILMIGEIRNFNTANTALRASITGRIVFSTLHTSDCSSTILRLSDMGIEKYIISAGLIGIISQRLVRKLCSCKKKVKKYVDIYNEELEYYEPSRCCKCHDGYIGRKAVFEILIMDQNIKEAINNGENLEKIKEIAINNGMVTLKDSLKEYLVNGITSLDEIYKNIMTIDDI